MAKAKQSVEQHQIDEDGITLFKSVMPRGWKIREYRPDYGLDFAVEVFGDPDEETKSRETLGEHFFVQLKSTTVPETAKIDLYARGNVEKSQEQLSDDLVAQIEIVRINLEISELVTVQRMGIAVPVILVVADLTNGRCNFVCLNDYIDKILIPRFDDYASATRRRIHIPTTNDISSEVGLTALRWYAKRAKLLAAFQRFTFQYAELQYAQEGQWRKLAEHFAKKIEGYDFWDDVEMCKIIEYYRDGLRRFIDSGQPQLIKRIPLVDQRTEALEVEGYLEKQDVYELWRGLSILPRNYEDVWREWFLPSALGHLSSAPE